MRITITLLILLLASSLQAQERKLVYNVVRNGNVVGTLNYSETNSNNILHISINSEVKTRFLFTFTAKAKEESTYMDDVLVYSSIYRNINGKVKANKQTTLNGVNYQIKNKGESSQLNIPPVHFNLHRLYLSMPNQIDKVYSDNFSKYVPIEKISENKYKIILPDGNYNYYYYKNGVCQKIEIHHTLYSAELILKQ